MLQRAATVGSRLSSHRPEETAGWTATEESQWSAELDQGNGLCATTVLSTTLTCTITGMSTTSPSAQFGTVRTCPCSIPAMPTTRSMNTMSLHNDGHVINRTKNWHLWDLHGLCTDSTERTCLFVNRNIHTLSMTRDIDHHVYGNRGISMVC